MEEWRDIDEFEGKYKISNIGRVVSVKRNLILKSFISNSGYAFVCFTINGKSKGRFIHRLMSQAFIPNPNNYSQVNHINGNRLDNRLENFEWCNNSINGIHAYRILGRKHAMQGKFGKDNPVSKPIIQCDMEGNEIKEWDCIADYVRATGRYQSGVSNALSGVQKSAHGYKWKFKNIEK